MVNFRTLGIAHEVVAERARQDAKWGEQNHPNFTPISMSVLKRLGSEGLSMETNNADSAKMITDEKAKQGTLSFYDILNEEVLEARDEAIDGEEEKLRVELIQVAAVAVSWVESIDRRRRVKIPPTHYVYAVNGRMSEMLTTFVKEAELFAVQGGLEQEWGRSWRGVTAESIEDARQKAKEMDWSKP